MVQPILKDLPEVQWGLVKASRRGNPMEKSSKGKRVHDPGGFKDF